MLHLVEKRGSSYITHSKVYKCTIKKARDKVQGGYVRWLFIHGLKLNWKLPNSNEIFQTTKGKRIIYAAWYGSNNLRAMKPFEKKYDIYKNAEGKVKLKKIDQSVYEVQDDDMEFLNLNMSETITNLTKKGDDKFKKMLEFGSLAVVALAIVLMIFFASKNYAVGMNDYNTGTDRIMPLVSWINDYGR
jgi:hypothetical protein